MDARSISRIHVPFRTVKIPIPKYSDVAYFHQRHVRIFQNDHGSGHSNDELVDACFRNRGLQAPLLNAGFVQFEGRFSTTDRHSARCA
jgi:hypothetical protein